MHKSPTNLWIKSDLVQCQYNKKLSEPPSNFSLIFSIGTWKKSMKSWCLQFSLIIQNWYIFGYAQPFEKLHILARWFLRMIFDIVLKCINFKSKSKYMSFEEILTRSIIVSHLFLSSFSLSFLLQLQSRTDP